MGNVRLFESWTFLRKLPEPFAEEAAKTGSRKSSDESAVSIHNRMTRGKSATLHAPTLRALMLLADLRNGNAKGAAGYQEKDGKIVSFCMESVDMRNPVPETRVLIYSPEKGKRRGICRGILHRGGTYSPIPKFGEKGISGKEILAVLAYASTVKESPLYDEEFAAAFKDFCDEMRNLSDADNLVVQGFLLCDNLYRRIENADALGSSGIPFAETNLNTGDIPILMQARMDSGYYAPTHTDFGVFEILKEKAREGIGTIGSIGKRYCRGFELTEEEKRMVPSLPETYEVSEEVMEIVEAVCNTPMRVFMSAGDAGTGKSTNAKIVAQLLGLPYYFFTCGEGTDEVDLVSSMVPNIGTSKHQGKQDLPTFRDMMMDPASALERVSGVYEEDIDAESAFGKIMDLLYQEGFKKGKKEKDFCLMESSIVTGCRRPSLIEIQEPSVIAKPGTLVKLNGLLDDGASITLANGEVVRRNPETVILLTTNMDYSGCRGFNESVLSRMRLLQFLEPLTAQEMVDRVLKKVDFPDKYLLKQMADTVCEIQKFCRTEMISGGVCGYREFEDWVWAYLVQKDICRAAKRTVIAKAAPEKEDREELFKNLVKTKFPEKKAA